MEASYQLMMQLKLLNSNFPFLRFLRFQKLPICKCKGLRIMVRLVGLNDRGEQIKTSRALHYVKELKRYRRPLQTKNPAWWFVVMTFLTFPFEWKKISYTPRIVIGCSSGQYIWDNYRSIVSKNGSLHNIVFNSCPECFETNILSMITKVMIHQMPLPSSTISEPNQNLDHQFN